MITKFFLSIANCTVQRFQPSETKKQEVVQIFMTLVLKGVLELFVLKVVTCQLNKTNFLLHCDHIWPFVKSATNVNCLGFLQFFQVSLAALTNWCLKVNFYSISENKYNI